MDKNPVETFPGQFHKMSHKICDTICKSGVHFGIFQEILCDDNLLMFADVTSSILFGQECIPAAFRVKLGVFWPPEQNIWPGPRPMWRSNRLPRIARELIRGQKTRANPYFGPGRIFYVAVKWFRSNFPLVSGPWCRQRPREERCLGQKFDFSDFLLDATTTPEGGLGSGG